MPKSRECGEQKMIRAGEVIKRESSINWEGSSDHSGANLRYLPNADIDVLIKQRELSSSYGTNQMQHQQFNGAGAGASSSSSSSFIVNTSTPCAACKLLRRRCAEECTFAPYFSPHDPQRFASVHKIYGASNVSKMLLEVPESRRADTANSLVYEANARLRDPVYGCMGLISRLQHQAQLLQAELQAVRAQVAHYNRSLSGGGGQVIDTIHVAQPLALAAPTHPQHLPTPYIMAATSPTTADLSFSSATSKPLASSSGAPTEPFFPFA